MYCLETSNMCITLYKWYKIPPSVHKVLFHGSDIIKSINVGFGRLSEKPQEVNNKIFRKARAANKGMYDRISTNFNIVLYLLIASDSVISNLRIKEKQKQKPLSDKAENMLIQQK